MIPFAADESSALCVALTMLSIHCSSSSSGSCGTALKDIRVIKWICFSKFQQAQKIPGIDALPPTRNCQSTEQKAHGKEQEKEGSRLTKNNPDVACTTTCPFLLNNLPSACPRVKTSITDLKHPRNEALDQTQLPSWDGPCAPHTLARKKHMAKQTPADTHTQLEPPLRVHDG